MNNVNQQLLKKFGENIAKIREVKKLSLRQVASRCNLDNGNISKIEKGVVDIRISTLVELSNGLGVHPKKLLDFEMNG